MHLKLTEFRQTKTVNSIKNFVTDSKRHLRLGMLLLQPTEPSELQLQPTYVLSDSVVGFLSLKKLCLTLRLSLNSVRFPEVIILFLQILVFV